MRTSAIRPFSAHQNCLFSLGKNPIKERPLKMSADNNALRQQILTNNDKMYSGTVVASYCALCAKPQVQFVCIHDETRAWMKSSKSGWYGGWRSFSVIIRLMLAPKGKV